MWGRVPDKGALLFYVSTNVDSLHGLFTDNKK